MGRYIQAQVGYAAQVESDGKRACDRNPYVGFRQRFGQPLTNLNHHGQTPIGLWIVRFQSQAFINVMAQRFGNGGDTVPCRSMHRRTIGFRFEIVDVDPHNNG